jgi:UDP-2,4-diacetamido-2,4,6-trideoxy-beta-L-altropyranose hydrolase
VRKKVIIRADGSLNHGLGHIVRSFSFAQMINAAFDVEFVCREIPESIAGEIKDKGFGLRMIEDEDPFINELGSADIVVLDGYKFNFDYQAKVKNRGCKLVCIDDQHNQKFVADLIINHAPGVNASDYDAGPDTEFALGPDYALLRPDFLQQAKKNRVINSIETVMICFGGGDYLNLTAQTLVTVAGIPHFKKIVVITGPSYNNRESLEKIVQSDNRVQCFHDLTGKEMLERMLDAELAIVPASGILFEALSVGCIVVSGHYISNQMDNYHGFLALNAFLDAKDFQQKYLNKVFTALDISGLNRHIIDGNSDQRMLQKIKLLV